LLHDHCAFAMTLEYVLITPARNEAAFIEKTIRSVIAQTVLPKRWVIVSDGSTDGTDEIVQRYLAGRDWMLLVRLSDEEARKRSFAAKVHAFDAGLAAVADVRFDVIGNLDADVSFGDDYFEYLLGQFEALPDLGVAGTHYTEDGFHSYHDSYINVDHVNGQCQLFRRNCFADVGGYKPIDQGGIDWVAVTTARMNGWVTRAFAGRTFEHHRKMGTASGSELKARFHYGRKDHFLGGHPLWQLCRGVFQMTKRPYVIGGLCLLAGYSWSWLTLGRRPISDELIRFHRREQISRLKELLARSLRLQSPLHRN
jgi:glycosyltransferase involved in cell wall biosynthesis